ncbi:MAG: gfo/Idh/MocA family oxidoreductase, partial [Caldivirga sp.]|nr:gfo/Idh/MocA family oxidoreductase [Caldivirga sp.]
MDKVRVGVIGVGGHGRGRHLIPYTKLPNVEVVAVADV